MSKVTKTKKLIDLRPPSGRIEIPKNLDNEVNRRLVGRTPNQKKVIKAILENDIIFIDGCAGTGKTTLSVGVGIELLAKEKIEKIILVRAAVEAGEKIGFSPGDVEQKMSPYLQPVYHALYKFLTVEQVNKYKKESKIEICPIAYMRGVTFENALVVVDESQNIRLEQLEMIITRLGLGSKLVFNADITQCDLPDFQSGAFELYRDYLQDIDGIISVQLTPEDNQRHPLITKVMTVMHGKRLEDRLSLKPRKLGEY